MLDLSLSTRSSLRDVNPEKTDLSATKRGWIINVNSTTFKLRKILSTYLRDKERGTVHFETEALMIYCGAIFSAFLDQSVMSFYREKHLLL